MIDIHCHLLPGIDDGARNVDDALAMARAAVADGIHFSVMTPHIQPGRYHNTRTTIERSIREFRRALAQAQIPLQIGMAAEVRLAPEILPLLEQDEIPFYGELDGFRLMLLEFPHSHIPPGADKLVDKLLQLRVRPIIAHPERNKDVMRDVTKIEPFTEMGCFLQLTASAVAGRFGKDAYKRSLQILEMDVFKVLATDAHNLKARYPELMEGRDAAAKIIGEEAADDMVSANPMAIAQSQMYPHENDALI
jgi:protein-tyrosine phosphatase